jgi:hypothetical protein
LGEYISPPLGKEKQLNSKFQMFQLVAPLESDPHASYVFAEGFVNGYGSQFYQCYDSQGRNNLQKKKKDCFSQKSK